MRGKHVHRVETSLPLSPLPVEHPVCGRFVGVFAWGKYGGIGLTTASMSNSAKRQEAKCGSCRGQIEKSLSMVFVTWSADDGAGVAPGDAAGDAERTAHRLELQPALLRLHAALQKTPGLCCLWRNVHFADLGRCLLVPCGRRWNRRTCDGFLWLQIKTESLESVSEDAAASTSSQQQQDGEAAAVEAETKGQWWDQAVTRLKLMTCRPRVGRHWGDFHDV